MNTDGSQTMRGETLGRLYDQIVKIDTDGCGLGRVHSQELKDVSRRISELEQRFWWIIVLLISNLTATIINLLEKQLH